MTTPDLFRVRLETMIDLHHPLAVLATRMTWVGIESALTPCFAHRDRKECPIGGLDLFGPALQVAGAGTNPAGRPHLPVRLMAGLLYRKHAFGKSDESVVRKRAGNPYWQLFCGGEYFEPRLPCDPGDSRPLEAARREWVPTAKRAALVLRQAIGKEGRSFKRQHPTPGRVMHDLECRLPHMARDMRQIVSLWLKCTRRIHSRPPKGTSRQYALQAPEAGCIDPAAIRMQADNRSKPGISRPAIHFMENKCHQD